MIDVFYVLGSGSKWNNNEIRYSLRSLEKYGKNVGEVYIVGERPSFISDKIKYISCKDIGSPACNHWFKVKRFFTETNAERGCYMMDDVFFTKDVDLENYPYCYNRELPEFKFNDSNFYHRTLLNTRKELLKRNLPIKSFEVHCPIIYERDKFMALNQDFCHFQNLYRPFVGVRSFYCNMNGIEGKYTTDLKIRKKYLSDWQERIKQNDFFSIADEVIHEGVGDWLKEHFPIPSKYEKTL